MSTASTSSPEGHKRKKIRISTISKYKGTQKISCLTCYDSTMASILDETDIDVVLVGDSLGHVVQGHDSTLPVTLEHMCYHTSCVAKKLNFALLVADLPFGSCGILRESTIQGAISLMRSGAHAVKLEGSSKETVEVIRILTTNGIPVMGHLGFTPQSVHQLGGYKIQKNSAEQAFIQQALDLQAAGCFAVVLELFEDNLAQEMTKRLNIPTIGIGAGPHCDGQVLVTQDMLGLNPKFNPKFLKKYRDLFLEIKTAITEYISEVRSSTYPNSREE